MNIFNHYRLTNNLFYWIKFRFISHNLVMAKSKFEYVKGFEDDYRCLMDCWIIVRLDGKGFHRFTKVHNFIKPNDSRGLKLMSKAASTVMEEFKDVAVAFGHSDEYSFVFKKNTSLYNRRREKIISLVSSIFSSSYIFYWNDYFTEQMMYPPSFDARIVVLPADRILRDYLSWRQADAHINNLYNTCFWALVEKKHLSPQEAEETLRGTVSSEKNELLFKEFGVNYNNEEPMYRKGTTLLRKKIFINDEARVAVVPFFLDIIKDNFWHENSEVFSMGKTPVYKETDQLEYFLKKTKET